MAHLVGNFTDNGLCRTECCAGRGLRGSACSANLLGGRKCSVATITSSGDLSECRWRGVECSCVFRYEPGCIGARPATRVKRNAVCQEIFGRHRGQTGGKSAARTRTQLHFYAAVRLFRPCFRPSVLLPSRSKINQIHELIHTITQYSGS